MIYLINKDNRILFDHLLQRMFVQRAQVFIDRLKWDLETTDGQERDQFDTDDTIYLIAVDDESDIIRSSMRLNPTTEPHLMSELFDHLCDQNIPRGQGVWEISRYCYNPEVPGRSNRLRALREIMCGVLECALLYGWKQLTFVTGMALMPHCLRCGCDISPLGLPQKDKRDSICAFAVNVTPGSLLAVRDYAGFADPTLKIIPGKSLAA